MFEPIGINPSSNVQMDTTMTKISWTEFYDLEEEIAIPFTHGIQHFEVALGKHIFNTIDNMIFVNRI